jgi:hypothetical protein
MSKYSFARISPIEFESMVQALLEKTYRVGGNLIQFGSGKDGGREATWSQPINHPTYSRPTNKDTDVVKEWVFQVKYHDLDQRGWSAARNAVVDDLDKELEKIVHKYAVPCHAYVMITNVPFTGARDVGTRDLITAASNKWYGHISEIYVWDAADLSRMLDANEDVRTAYLDTILSGDILKALYSTATSKVSRKHSAFRAYLKFITEREKSARAEEAGDDPNLPLAQVFIDLTLKIKASSKNELPFKWLDLNQKSISDEERMLLLDRLMHVRSSFTLFFADYPYTLLLGGPGLGKSTLTQFLSLYQAARIVDPKLSKSLASRLKLPEGKEFKDLDASCRPRYPFRIELRLYAKWISKQQDNENQLARYIVESLINPNASSKLKMDDVFELASNNPVLLVLDGLDEVPNPEIRRQIIENLHIFLRRIDAENGDVQVILSSRPKGYSGEFDVFEPITWELNELERPDFDEYCDRWLKNRIKDTEARNDAQERINRGMMAESVQRLACSLLQATVILTIVRRKVEIPHQRNLLYKKYVDVIFDREKEKSEIVSAHEPALMRLHERVGYELHCKMEQPHAEAIDPETFRGYVLNVLEDYSAPNIGNRKIRDVANEIINAATDRLCLLIGRGKDQADVDFVVQQYREYFAALYLSNHANADPERVFDMLVSRGAYWAYVLQFYVAQASANQQIRWVTGIPDRLDDESNFEAIIRKTRVYRSTLNILPEFALQPKIYFERVLKIIFSLETRWTWLEQESIIEILQLIPSIDIIQVFCSFFEALSLADNSILVVEIWLFAQLDSSESQEDSSDTLDKIRSLLGNEQIHTLTLMSAFQNRIKIDLSNYTIDEITLAWEELNKHHRNYRRRTRWQPYNIQSHLRSLLLYQNTETQCRILISSNYFSSWYNAALISLDQSLDSLPGEIDPKVKLQIVPNSLDVEFRDYLYGRLYKTDFLNKLNKKLSKIGGSSSKYLASLMQAISNPLCNKLDEHARAIELEFSQDINHLWSPDYILGPSATNFSSVNEWKLFKQNIYNASQENPNWICDDINFNEYKNLWMCFLFHPDYWFLLVTEKLITERDYDYLKSTILGNILQLPKQHLDIFQMFSLLDEEGEDIPLYQIISVTLYILKKDNIKYINSTSLIGAILYQNRIKIGSVEEINSLLTKSNDLTSIPSVWVSAILRLCIDIPDVNIELLLDFWEQNEYLKPRFLFIRKENLSGRWNQFLEAILYNNRPSALRLSAAITANSKPSEENEIILRNRLIAEYNSYFNVENTCEEFFQSLLNLSPILEEFSLWIQPEVIKKASQIPLISDKINQRFMIASSSKSKIDLIQLRGKLSIFVANRNEYPTAIVLGALEAILKIDEANLPILDSKIWQQCFDE